MKKKAQFWKNIDNETVQCLLCAHSCKIKNNNTGICGVRKNESGELYTLIYGSCSSISPDPIEKKPLYHFYPGTNVLSFGTIGCNFKCSYCQNYEISTAHPESNYLQEYPPEEAIKMAKRYNCKGIAWTYNEPTIWYEYTLDSARLAKKSGLYTVYVTNGYINEEPLKEIAPGVFSGSDCTLFAKSHPNPTTHSSIEKVFNDYQKHADDDGNGLNDCMNLHPANAECCGYEYMTEWGSACGSTALGLDTFSEIEESTCLSAQRVGINQLTVPGRAPLSCGRTFNSVSGLCSEKGTRPIEPIKVVAFSDANVQTLGLDDFGKEKFMYLFVIPKENAPDQFDIKLGYLVEQLKFRRSNESNAIAYSQRHYFNADLQAIDLPVNVQQFFTQTNLEVYHSNPERLNNLYGQFASTLSGASGSTVSVDMSRRIFGNVVGVISTLRFSCEIQYRSCSDIL